MENSITRTLNRLLVKIHLPGFETVRLFLEGLAVEFGRVIEMKNRVLSVVVPNVNMDTDAIEDYNEKYGIPQYLTGTDAQKINRIIERASLVGHGGPEWLEEQIQKAGFALYVHLNLPTDEDELQLGDFQMSSTIQFGSPLTYIDPELVPGELIVGTHPTGGSWIITDDAFYWGYYFFLSPFSDRLAAAGELLELSQQQYNYLYKVITSLKYMRNRCIAQVEIVS
ncbi:MAG: hypothetical protein CVV44_03800 [Spirochaetae bacterium HGW-Spirochaetae-1]|jgi:hypothetical protein|nr:MAG: hypothetical protein CVV44_03800 [Spirochaetae bacterium HGW-Spirochaetae-1]